MSTIIPKNAAIKDAIAWVAMQLEDNPTKRFMACVDEATLRFDLSPNEAEFLIGFFRNREKDTKSTST